ncbi:MAG: hypothetical protein HC840_17305 [Leptolyngbyaceae cyanobacterium RM2_2_4]|nr:hypothetical protein [Leptolyngbyaceae cyanobacterium RM2_2_4]
MGALRAVPGGSVYTESPLEAPRNAGTVRAKGDRTLSNCRPLSELSPLRLGLDSQHVPAQLCLQQKLLSVTRSGQWVCSTTSRG